MSNLVLTAALACSLTLVPSVMDLDVETSATTEATLTLSVFVDGETFEVCDSSLSIAVEKTITLAIEATTADLSLSATSASLTLGSVGVGVQGPPGEPGADGGKLARVLALEKVCAFDGVTTEFPDALPSDPNIEDPNTVAIDVGGEGLIQNTTGVASPGHGQFETYGTGNRSLRFGDVRSSSDYGRISYVDA